MEVLGGLVDVPLTLVLVVLLLVIIYIYQTWYFSTWKDLCIPGPPPKFLFGNIPLSPKTDFITEQYRWKEKYGRTYGMFMFREPMFVTSDPELIKEVMIKEFNKFSDRYTGFDRVISDFSWKMIFNARNPAWKRYRHVMTPAFTTGKLKALEGYIIQCSKVLCQVLKDKADKQEDIDLKAIFQRFTMDVIAGTAFGLDTNLQRGEDTQTHDMIKAMKGILSNLSSTGIILIAVAFPFMAPLLRAMGYDMFPPKDLNFFKQCISAIIHERDQNPEEAKKRVDFLQQMLDIRVAPGEEVTDLDDASFGTKTNKKLTEEEVVAQGIQVFNAGFETTASGLRFLSYILATHPDIQEKLYQEIQEVIGDGELRYEQLQELKYMDLVVTETLRMYPVVPGVTRLASETVNVKGYCIQKGMPVLIPIYMATHDPEFYPDPDSFKPERFADGKDSLMAALPFGVGPRQCIGMRLALQEVKTAVVYICRQIKFVACDKTPKTLEFEPNPLLSPREPVIVRAELRT